MAFDTEPEPRNELMTHSAITQIVSQRDAALAMMQDAAAQLTAAYKQSASALAMMGDAAAGHSFYMDDRREGEHYKRLSRDRYDAEKSLDAFRKHLDASVWVRLMEETGLRVLMDRTECEKFDKSLADQVPEVTEGTIRATFEQLGANSDLTFKRGLAKAFIRLDDRFKSHDAFKLDARIILTRVFDESGYWSYSSYSRATITDVERVFAVLDGKAPNPGALFKAVDESRGGYGARQSEAETDYFKIRGFKNGNAHLWFTRPDLVTAANKVLADYYGAIVPDAATKDMNGEAFRGRSNVPAKDLQFYATPEEAAAILCKDLHIEPGKTRILEPSAGSGAIIKPLAARGARIDAVELHPDRVAQLRALARSYGDLVNVTGANFLQMRPVAAYDYVMMNPPFYGTHYMQHVRHAFDFLQPGGILRAILPASAQVNETPAHLAFRRWAEKHARSWTRQWQDLPPESFAASGTNIQTVILEMRR